MGDSSGLLGKIILARFLEQTPEEFSAFFSQVESHPLLVCLLQQGILCLRYLGPHEPDPKVQAEVVARFTPEGRFIYLRRESAVVFEADGSPPAGVTQEARLLFHRIRRINTRNAMLQRVLRGVGEAQRGYFAAPTPDLAIFSLRPLSLRRLCRAILQGRPLPFKVDPSRVSRLVRSLWVEDPWGKRIPLTAFFSSKRGLLRLWVKELLREEKASGAPYSDSGLASRIQTLTGLSVTPREIASVRSELGIPPSNRRNGYDHQVLSRSFSPLLPLSSHSIRLTVPPRPGVYELSLRQHFLEYPRGWSRTLYIGSSKNLRKRLAQHLSPKEGHPLARYLGCYEVSFRFLVVDEGWLEEERELLESFVESYGAVPLCNSVVPKGGRGKDRKA